jgi:hypothetical protein
VGSTGEETENWAVAYCGLNCAKCDMYEAGHGNEKKRGEILAWFKQERNKILKPEQITCEGCRGPLNAHWSEDCKMMLCAKNKKVQYCFQCSEFPCSILNAFASDGAVHHKKTVENLHRMKRIGVDAWIAEQEKNGKCEFCP